MPGPKNCQCDMHPEHPCINPMTEEDFLCNLCRPRCHLIALGMKIDPKFCCGNPNDMQRCILLSVGDEVMHVREVPQVRVRVAVVVPKKSTTDYEDAIRYMQNYVKSQVQSPWTLPSGDISYDQ